MPKGKPGGLMLAISAEMRARLDAEQARRSQRAGCAITKTAVLEALLEDALSRVERGAK